MIQNDFAGQKPIIHRLDDIKRKPPVVLISGFIVIVLLGVLTGFLVSRSTAKQNVSGASGTAMEKGDNNLFGSADTSVFKDTAQGDLEKGGIDGEGTHKLIRPGGESQTVYLTSSVLNLDKFTGKKVKVWGATFAAKKAGWLMDVGRVEVVE